MFIVLIVFSVGMTVLDKTRDSKLLLDEKILELINSDEMSGVNCDDTFVWKTEAENGYFCDAVSSEEEIVNCGYITNNDNQPEFAGKSFLSLPMVVYNEDPTLFQRTSILNYSEKNFYYGCYQYDNLQVIVNDCKVEIYNFTLNYPGEDFNMDFWFVGSETEPTVEII